MYKEKITELLLSTNREGMDKLVELSGKIVAVPWQETMVTVDNEPVTYLEILKDEIIMKGTYIKVLNEVIFDELEEIKAQRNKKS